MSDTPANPSASAEPLKNMPASMPDAGPDPSLEAAADRNNAVQPPSVTAGSPPAAEPQKMDALSELLISRKYITAEAMTAAMAKAKTMPKGNAIQILLAEGTLKKQDYETLRADVQSRQGQNLRIPGYEIMGFLGAGAMASVFKGRQQSLDRVVAIKVLPQKYSEDLEFVRRFAAEGKIAAKLNHPNIVQAYDEGIAGNQHFFVMEYIDGTTVHDVINQHGVYTEQEVLKIAILIADALAHAHHMGLIHRDVKPKNIMLTSRGVPKLADMGLAMLNSGPGEEEKGKIYGTPAYLAPEQAKPDVVLDSRADIYSFGATIYHMVIGHVPFPASTAVEMIQKHLNQEVESPHKANPNISTGLSDIIEVCMAKSPSARYASAEDLVADLKAVQNGGAPTIARRGFSIESIAAIDAPEGMVAPPKAAPPTIEEEAAAFFKAQAMQPKPLHRQKLFWWTVVGWGLAVLMMLVAIAK